APPPFPTRRSSDLRVVAIGDFVAVAAEREEHAIKAAKALKVVWKQPPDLIDLSDLDAAIRAQPSQERVLLEQAQVGAETPAGVSLECSYLWPYQMHASVGPSCSVADYQEGHVRVWSGSQT